MARQGGMESCEAAAAVSVMLQQGLERCSHRGNLAPLEHALAEAQAREWAAREPPAQEPVQAMVSELAPSSGGACLQKVKCKVRGVKLLPHEAALLEAGALQDVTHHGASAIWLAAPDAQGLDPTFVF